MNIAVVGGGSERSKSGDRSPQNSSADATTAATSPGTKSDSVTSPSIHTRFRPYSNRNSTSTTFQSPSTYTPRPVYRPSGSTTFSGMTLPKLTADRS